MSAHGAIDPSNRKVALLIAVLALFLAFAETFGKSAQTEALSSNIEASNLWAFFQAKTIRLTTVRTAAEAAELQLASAPAEAKPAIAKRIEDWRKTAARYESEPETKEGRKELAERAKAAEARRDRSLAAYHQFETACGAADRDRARVRGDHHRRGISAVGIGGLGVDRFCFYPDRLSRADGRAPSLKRYDEGCELSPFPLASQEERSGLKSPKR